MERNAKHLDEVISKVDKLVPSPSFRANAIYTILKNSAQPLTDWDIVCFCAESLGLMSAAFSWLEEDARKLCSTVYTAHYLNENWRTENQLRLSEVQDSELTVTKALKKSLLSRLVAILGKKK